MKKKLYIQESDLGEILEALAEETIKNSDKLSTHATIASNSQGTFLRVVVCSSASYETLVENTYYIVRELAGSDEIADDNITLALGKLKLAEQREAKSEETEEV